MGFLEEFRRAPSPVGCDVSDNGFPSRMDMHVFDTDHLLAALAALAIERR